MSNRCSVLIDAPRDKVFEWIYKPELCQQWLPNIIEHEILEKTDKEIGSRAKQVYLENGKRMEMISEVTEFEQDKMIRCFISGLIFDLDVKYILEDVDKGTKVSQEFELFFKGFFMRFMMKIMMPMMKKTSNKQSETSFEKLKGLIEADLAVS